MPLKNLFIAGMAKCGSTALSEWMVMNKLAEDRMPGEKEPRIYAFDRPHPGIFRQAKDLPLLDASVSYAAAPATIHRLPEIDTHIVLCLRNQFERAWSHYIMYKLVFGADGGEVGKQYLSSGASDNDPNRPIRKKPKVSIFDLHLQYFPRRRHNIVLSYLHKEVQHLLGHTFRERLDYEISFFLSRHKAPCFSILHTGMYYLPLRNLLEKFLPEDISVLSVHKLQDDDLRRQFVQQVFHEEKETPPVPFVFSSRNVDIGEEKPDFNDPAFDPLRSIFRYDLEQARALIAQTRFGTQLLDEDELNRYLHTETNPPASHRK